MTNPHRLLYRIHKLLITLAIVLGMILCLWGSVRYSTTGHPPDLLTAIGGITACIAAIFYLRWFRKKTDDT